MKNKRKKEWGTSQKDTMKEIRDTRKHTCIITGYTIPEPISWCFAHILPKGTYPKYRADPRNIALVYWLKEHWILDWLIVKENKMKIQIMLDIWCSYQEIEKYILDIYTKRCLSV